MSEQKIDDGGPALCRKCGVVFEPRAWQVRNSDYECPACKRSRQNTANRADPLFAEKRRARNALPHVRAYISAYSQKCKADPYYQARRAARRKVATEIEAGRMERKPCRVCGSVRSEAHHEDYALPLSVDWLCRRHHVDADAMLAARKGGAR